MGGLEAAHRVCGVNPLGIEIICETRDGHAESYDRHKKYDVVISPPHIGRMKITATKLAKATAPSLLYRASKPLFQATAA